MNAAPSEKLAGHPLPTAADKVVIRIAALCVCGASKSAYQNLICRLPASELEALLVMLGLTTTTISDVCDRVFETNWLPMLNARRHLIADTGLFRELGLI